MLNCCCVILNYNDAENSLKLAKAVSKFDTIQNVIVVDNCSTDQSLVQLGHANIAKMLVLATPRNGGYGFGNNYGMRYAFQKLDADAVLICNPDVAFSGEMVSRICDVLHTRTNCGVVSAVQYDRNGQKIDQSAWAIPKKINYIFSIGKLAARFATNFYQDANTLHQNPVTKVDCVAGSLLLISREAFEKTGGYDENVFLYCEETILGCKLKEAGLDTYICSDVNYEHLHGVSITKSVKSSVARKKLLLRSHHYTLEHYLHANPFQLGLDNAVAAVSIAEEYVTTFVKRLFAKQISHR